MKDCFSCTTTRLLLYVLNTTFCSSLDQTRQWADGESPTDHLQNVIYNYASAVGIKKKDANLHLQLGMVLEEKYYIEDMFGLKKEVGGNFTWAKSPEDLSPEFLNRSDTNWLGQPRKVAKGLKLKLEYTVKKRGTFY